MPAYRVYAYAQTYYTTFTAQLNIYPGCRENCMREDEFTRYALPLCPTRPYSNLYIVVNVAMSSPSTNGPEQHLDQTSTSPIATSPSSPIITPESNNTRAKTLSSHSAHPVDHRSSGRLLCGSKIRTMAVHTVHRGRSHRRNYHVRLALHPHLPAGQEPDLVLHPVCYWCCSTYTQCLIASEWSRRANNFHSVKL
jgi:hypothetical protein